MCAAVMYRAVLRDLMNNTIEPQTGVAGSVEYCSAAQVGSAGAEAEHSYTVHHRRHRSAVAPHPTRRIRTATRTNDAGSGPVDVDADAKAEYRHLIAQ